MMDTEFDEGAMRRVGVSVKNVGRILVAYAHTDCELYSDRDICKHMFSSVEDAETAKDLLDGILKLCSSYSIKEICMTVTRYGLELKACIDDWRCTADFKDIKSGTIAANALVEIFKYLKGCEEK